MLHRSRRSLYAVLTTALLLLLGAAAGWLQASAAPAAQSAAVLPASQVYANGARVVQSEKNDVSPPLRDIPPAQVAPGRKEGPQNPNPPVKVGKGQRDTVVQRSFGALAMPAPIASFDGINSISSSCGCLPPDTNADVGATQVVETANVAFAVYNKTGGVLLSARPINTLFTGFGGPCQTRNDGDPVVLYDAIANRWFISQFTSSAPYYMCIAVSTTADATGSYNRYGFLMSSTDLYDYEKYGVWPDAYYMTANVFQGDGNFRPTAVAFDRTRMLAGLTATFQEFNPGNFYSNILPATFNGTILPPAGAPNTFMSAAGNSNLIHTWKFHVDFVTPANSSFTGPVNLAAAPWDPNLCNGSRNCIQQPPPAAPTQYLDSLSDHLMFHLSYRNFGDHEAITANESVDENSADHSGIRWYEIRNPSSTPYIYQQGTYAPDANQRWMGAINMDRDGNIAVGYNTSSTTVFPSIRYAGRLATDPLGQLAQGEATLVAGSGVQQSASGRWGDYSSLSVDPTDDCTFWFAGEYYASTGNANWSTRIGSFKFPSCGATTPTVTPTGTPPTATRTASPTTTATAGPCQTYSFATTTGTLVPATSDTGNHCDDCTTLLTLPFPIALYGQSYTSAFASSNGVFEFGSSDSAFGNAPLPVAIFDHAVVPYWDDLITSQTGGGVFTSVTGVAPNRVYNVEWRAQVLNSGNANVNFEIQFPEGGTNSFSIVYGNAIGDGGAGATIGVQKDLNQYTQVSYNTVVVVAGRQYNFTLAACGSATVTPTRTATVGTTVTATASATQTPCGTAAGWTAGPNFPQVGVVRSTSAYYPANGRFYTLGGRTSDTAGSDLQNPAEYNPSTNTWTTKAAAFPDNQVNNMAGGVITIGGVDFIVAVGGSAAGATTASAAVRLYNPVADVLTALPTTENWPGNANGTTLPGGYTVANNKLYIIGGFNIGVGMTNQIWEYDPNAAGAHWTQKVNLPVARGYVPATTINNVIYTGGGSDFVAAAPVDTTDSFRFDPAANTIAAIANIPRATAETRAVTVNGKMWVLGGGRTAPNPSNEVDIYDPATTSWTVGTPFVTARRNFPAASDGANVYLVGGYAPTAPVNTMEIYHAAVPCNTPTATATASRTTVAATATASQTTVAATATASQTTVAATASQTTVAATATASQTSVTATATACPIRFTDVIDTNAYYYQGVYYLACRGVISGYNDGTFKPFNNTTRGQMTKIVTLAFNIPLVTPPALNSRTFTDVLPDNVFYQVIETAAAHNIVSGYSCGGVNPQTGQDEPCDSVRRPYFRPSNFVSRGQLTKIVVIGAGWTLVNPAQPTFTDVDRSNVFYPYIQTAVCHGVISGYSDNTFRPNNFAFRGQIAKIVYLALTASAVNCGNSVAAVDGVNW